MKNLGLSPTAAQLCLSRCVSMTKTISTSDDGVSTAKSGKGSSNGNGDDQRGVNVKVILRCRPSSDLEKKDPSQFHVVAAKVDAKEVFVSQTIPGRKVECYSKTFTFDGVCNQYTTQKDLFNIYVVPIVEEVLQGFNCTIFAYGQTGTGKTYTMEGDLYAKTGATVRGVSPTQPADILGAANRHISPPRTELTEHAGIIPRAVQHIFDRLEAQDAEYSVRVSYLEIYNEELNDLLNDGEKQNLRIYEDPASKKGLAVDRLEEIPVNNPQDIFNILSIAVKKRRTAETLLNRQSSRSHCIFSVTIHMRETNLEGEEVIKIGKLNLVDLAGSENIQRSGANTVKDRAKEAGMINQSLLTLGRVINALVEHSSYVPYRDSKLTRLLQESLGGRTKTCIVATVSPSSLCLEETLSTLDYAFRAKNIRNRPEVNQRMTKRVMIRELNHEIERLKVELQANREKNGVYLPYDRFSEMEARLASRENELSDASAEIERMRTDTARITFQLEETQNLLLQETAELKASHQKLETSQMRVGQLTDDLTLCQDQLAESRAVAAEYRRVEDLLRARCSDLFQQLNRTGEEVNAALNLLSQSRVQRQTIQNSINEYLAHLEKNIMLSLSTTEAASQDNWRQLVHELRTATLQQLESSVGKNGPVLQRTLRDLQTNSRMLSDGFVSSISDVSKDVSQSFKNTSENIQSAIRNISAKMNISIQSIDAGIVSFEQNIQETFVEITNSAATVKQLADDQNGKTAGTLGRVSAQLQGVKEYVVTELTSASGQIGGLEQKLALLESKQNKTTQEKFEKLFDIMRRESEQLIRQQKEELKASMVSVIDQCTTMKQHTTALSVAMDEEVSSNILQPIQSLHNDSCTTFSHIVNSIRNIKTVVGAKPCKRVNESAAAIQRMTKDVTEQTGYLSKVIEEEILPGMQSNAEQVSISVDKLQSSVKEQHQQNSRCLDMVLSTTDELINSVTTSTSQASATMTQIESTSAAHHQQINTIIETSMEMAESVKSQISVEASFQSADTCPIRFVMPPQLLAELPDIVHSPVQQEVLLSSPEEPTEIKQTPTPPNAAESSSPVGDEELPVQVTSSPLGVRQHVTSRARSRSAGRSSSFTRQPAPVSRKRDRRPPDMSLPSNVVPRGSAVLLSPVDHHGDSSTTLSSQKDDSTCLADRKPSWNVLPLLLGGERLGVHTRSDKDDDKDIYADDSRAVSKAPRSDSTRSIGDSARSGVHIRKKQSISSIPAPEKRRRGGTT